MNIVHNSDSEIGMVGIITRAEDGTMSVNLISADAEVGLRDFRVFLDGILIYGIPKEPVVLGDEDE